MTTTHNDDLGSCGCACCIRGKAAVEAMYLRQLCPGCGGGHRMFTMDEILELRGVVNPCERCSGFGTRTYGSTATWRGGVGGQTATIDVCDGCWGSGDAQWPWPDQRKQR